MNKDLQTKIQDFTEMISTRRSNYTLTNHSDLTNQGLVDFIYQCFYNCPSPFNVQSARMVILFDRQHEYLWTHIIDKLEKPLPQKRLAALNSCLQAHATIVFYDDTAVIEKAAIDNHMVLDNFLSWGIQSNAMLQYIIWTGLSTLGYGASLQHYNGLTDLAMKRLYNIPSHWKLVAQLVFGKSNAIIAERMHLDKDTVISVKE